jgi:ABC-2 type transport system ATP-binding protein
VTLLLEASSLVKRYGERTVINDVTVYAEAGEIVGLIGPNGAGKTTLLSILSGLTAATSGVINYRLDETARLHPQRSIGFASPEMPMFDYLTAREVLLACGAVHGLSRATSERRCEELLSVFELSQACDYLVAEFSQGMRQKLNLCVALLHDPMLYCLDEPFDGLDSTACYRLAQLLGQLANAGRAIIVSSHDLGLVERLCHRVLILQNGCVVHAGSGRTLQSGGSDGSGLSSMSTLETLMWDVVGHPEMRRLTWLPK